MDHLTDAELWSRGCEGDHAAAGELFRRHAQAVFTFLVRRVGDRDLAEDLTSAVFLDAWRKRKEVKLQGDSALPWLYGVAFNCARNARRSLHRHRAALGRLALERQSAGSLEEASELRRVLELLRRLPEDQRDVVVACAWTGLSYEDAALALGIPVGTVRSRLSRARTRLAELETRSVRLANPTPVAPAGRTSHEP